MIRPLTNPLQPVSSYVACARCLHEVTPTEWEVWRHIADPKDEKYEVIYPDLHMTKRNFDKHKGSLFNKLGVHKRSGAVRLWELFGKRLQGGV